MREGVHSFYTVMFTLSRRRRANHNTPGVSVRTWPYIASLRLTAATSPPRELSDRISNPHKIG